MVDWADVLKSVNDYREKKEGKARFDNLKQMFGVIYNEWSSKKICEVTFVSWPTITSKVKELGFTLKPHGGKRFCKQLPARQFGCESEASLLRLLRREKFTYLQMEELFKSVGVSITASIISRKARNYGIKGCIGKARTWEETRRAIKEGWYRVDDKSEKAEES